MEANIDKKLSMEATQNGIDQLYTVQKVAELLSVDDAFVLELIKTKKITGIKLNDRMTRIPAGSIQRYLAKLTK
jgi:excisionase family DNA binding protein